MGWVDGFEWAALRGHIAAPCGGDGSIGPTGAGYMGADGARAGTSRPAVDRGMGSGTTRLRHGRIAALQGKWEGPRALRQEDHGLGCGWSESSVKVANIRDW